MVKAALPVHSFAVTALPLPLFGTSEAWNSNSLLNSAFEAQLEELRAFLTSLDKLFVMAYRSSQECNSLNPRLEEVRAALRTDEVKTATSKMTLVERAVWLVDHKLFRIPDVSVVLDLSPNVVRSALGAVHEGRVIGHVGRPRTLHDDSEKELCDKITSKSLEGHPLTKAQCLVLVRQSSAQAQLSLASKHGRRLRPPLPLVLTLYQLCF